MLKRRVGQVCGSRARDLVKGGSRGAACVTCRCIAQARNGQASVTSVPNLPVVEAAGLSVQGHAQRLILGSWERVETTVSLLEGH